MSFSPLPLSSAPHPLAPSRAGQGARSGRSATLTVVVSSFPLHHRRRSLCLTTCLVFFCGRCLFAGSVCFGGGDGAQRQEGRTSNGGNSKLKERERGNVTFALIPRFRPMLYGCFGSFQCAHGKCLASLFFIILCCLSCVKLYLSSYSRFLLATGRMNGGDRSTVR